MNAACPRCGTLMLVSHEARRYTCPTCRTRYCRRCQSWKDQKQRYCLNCGLNFSAPPGALVHAAITRSAGLALLSVALFAPFYALWSPWYGLASSLLVLGAYFAVYLARFQRKTLLTWAARREALLIARQGIVWSSVIYFLVRRGQAEAMGVLIVGTLLAAGLGLLVINRLNPRVLDELRANRATWKAVLAMKLGDALLMRFPAAQSSG